MFADAGTDSGLLMLLHASNFSLNLWGTDIDPLVIAACKINGVLYAPWLAFRFPAEIVPPPPTRSGTACA